MNDLDFTWLKGALLLWPQWDSLNAYERTKVACAELTRKGLSVPGWPTLRDIIGKGSASDINRGKDDYRVEHGEYLSNMQGFEQGFPAELTPFVTQLWEGAINAVRTQLARQEEVMHEHVAQVDAAMEQAIEKRDSAIHRAETLTKQLDDAKELHIVLRSQIESERAMRMETEQRLDAHMSEIKQQRDQLEAALQTNRNELHAALERIDGAQKHTLMQVEEARTTAKQSIQEAHQRNERAMSSVTNENARLSKLVNEATSRRAALEKKIDQLTTELKDRELIIARLAASKSSDDSVSTPRGTLLKQRRTIQRRNSPK